MAFNPRLLSAHAAFNALLGNENRFLSQFDRKKKQYTQDFYDKALERAIEEDCKEHDYSMFHYPIFYALASAVQHVFYTKPLKAIDIMQEVIDERDGIVQTEMIRRQIDFIHQSKQIIQLHEANSEQIIGALPNTISNVRKRLDVAAHIFSETGKLLTNTERSELFDLACIADEVKNMPPRIPFIIPPFGDA